MFQGHRFTASYIPVLLCVYWGLFLGRLLNFSIQNTVGHRRPLKCSDQNRLLQYACCWMLQPALYNLKITEYLNDGDAESRFQWNKYISSLKWHLWAGNTKITQINQTFLISNTFVIHSCVFPFTLYWTPMVHMAYSICLDVLWMQVINYECVKILSFKRESMERILVHHVKETKEVHRKYLKITFDCKEMLYDVTHLNHHFHFCFMY